jgi:hypothetical protein
MLLEPDAAGDEACALLEDVHEVMGKDRPRTALTSWRVLACFAIIILTVLGAAAAGIAFGRNGAGRSIPSQSDTGASSLAPHLDEAYTSSPEAYTSSPAFHIPDPARVPLLVEGQPVTLEDLMGKSSGCFADSGILESDRKWDKFVVIQVDNRMTRDQIPVTQWHTKQNVRASFVWNALMAKALGYQHRVFVGPKVCRHPVVSRTTPNLDISDLPQTVGDRDLFPSWCKLPILLLASSIFPNAAGILFVGSDVYLRGDIGQFLRETGVTLDGESPLFGAIETDLPGQPGWIDLDHAMGVYNQSVAINSDTVLLRPGSGLALDALWRLWNVGFYTPSSLEEYHTNVLITFTVEAPAACALAAAMGGSDALQKKLWNAVLSSVSRIAPAGAAAMRLSRDVDALVVTINDDGDLQVRLWRLQSLELIEALLVLFDRLKNHESMEWSRWREDLGNRSGCMPTGVVRVEPSKQYYAFHGTWPAEQDRMQDLAKKHPNLLRPIRLQYNPLFLDEAFLSKQSRPYLVWHASAMTEMKEVNAKAAVQLIKTNGDALFGIKRLSEEELDALMHTWYSHLNATDVRDLDCCMERVGWHTVGEHTCANHPTEADARPALAVVPTQPPRAGAAVSAQALPTTTQGPASAVGPPVALPDQASVTKCSDDSPAWDNRKGLSCAQYESLSFCRGGLVVQNWTTGAAFNFPERHCCVCGKGR